MADRRCPNCGELVPSNSVTCPKCYKKIPAEPEPRRRERPPEESAGEPGRKQPSHRVAFWLDAILGLFGLCGIGHLYNRDTHGFAFLFGGLFFFLLTVLLVMVLSVLSVIFAIPLMIIYALIYLASLADVALGLSTLRSRMRSR